MVIRETENENINFSVNPNPSTRNIQIQTSIKNPKINLLDLLGSTLLVTTKKDIDLSYYSKGIYIIS